jgi:hypothetical protein
MSTLMDLGLTAMGNYVEGVRNGIVLNKKGAEKFNLWYPTPNREPNFTPGNLVEINCKLPDQQDKSTAKVVVKGNNGSVSSLIVLNQDDWFERQVPISSTSDVK